MGRTNATYRDLLRALQERWGTYRRGLRREDQVHFDRLFTHARNYADASGLQNHEDPVVPVLVSIALAQEKHLLALESRIDALEAALEAAGETDLATDADFADDGSLAERPSAVGNKPESETPSAAGNSGE